MRVNDTLVVVAIRCVQLHTGSSQTGWCAWVVLLIPTHYVFCCPWLGFKDHYAYTLACEHQPTHHILSQSGVNTDWFHLSAEPSLNELDGGCASHTHTQWCAYKILSQLRWRFSHTCSLTLRIMQHNQNMSPLSTNR